MPVETLDPALERLREITPIDRDIRSEIQLGLTTSIYGPYVRKMVQHAADGVLHGNLDGKLVELALADAAMLFRFADADYKKGEHPLFDKALEHHQANVLAGKIELIPMEAATTIEQGIKQVATADSFLSDQAVQTTLAAINYGAFFRPETMASAARTLERSEINKLLTDASSSQEAMPHLTVSNWAIGQIVAGAYRYASRLPQGRLRIFDIGSGNGATIAATTSSIQNVEGLNRRPELAITALEATPEFCDELTNFVSTDKGIAALGLKPVNYSWLVRSEMSRFGALTVVRGDAVSSLLRSNLTSGISDSDITIITGNYSWHRFSSKAKTDIMKMCLPLQNVIFLIGDLAENTSVINRRYFNLGVNGPLNCGNRQLRHQFENLKNWYVNLDQEKPASLDPRLAKRIAQENKNNDGHLWIAFYGTHASQALNLVPAA